MNKANGVKELERFIKKFGKTIDVIRQEYLTEKPSEQNMNIFVHHDLKPEYSSVLIKFDLKPVGTADLSPYFPNAEWRHYENVDFKKAIEKLSGLGNKIIIAGFGQDESAWFFIFLVEKGCEELGELIPLNWLSENSIQLTERLEMGK